MKYIVVTGGVLSGLGKGITASSLGLLLKLHGFRVTAIKIDPYLNCDAGTMNPYQHGEVYVLDDGGEVDLDLGNYERFLDITLTSDHNITTGKVYKAVIDRERRGDYLGQTVQIVPHVTDEIRSRIRQVAESSGCDVVIVELGGTVGDIESMPFIEALRQLRLELEPSSMLYVHTTLVPVMEVVGEQKTKPTQHSVKQLMSMGILPDVIVCRSSEPLREDTRAKIAMFCNVPREAVLSAYDVGNIYQVPLLLEAQGATRQIMERLGIASEVDRTDEWRAFVSRLTADRPKATVSIVGKYTNLKDAYISHIKALDHAGAETGVEPCIRWIEAEDIEKKGDSLLDGSDAVIIPGGFGSRGANGKMLAARWARHRKVPFLGICFGFQLAVVDFCRDELGLEEANSSELDPNTPHPVVDLLPEQANVRNMGGTMRLGAQVVHLKPGSRVRAIYGEELVQERHRHRYEVNPRYISKIQAKGLRFSATTPDGRCMEVAEMEGHPFFMASQYHPEFRSRPGRPAPLYRGLLEAVRSRLMG